jgi:hypothetical protein
MVLTMFVLQIALALTGLLVPSSFDVETCIPDYQSLEGEQLAVFKRLDLYHKSSISGARQCKSRTYKGDLTPLRNLHTRRGRRLPLEPGCGLGLHAGFESRVQVFAGL